MKARVLLLAAHPDDEVVGCAAAIARARDTRFFALYLTTGVPAADWPWRRGRHPTRVERRRQEALAAASALGLEPVGFSLRPSRELRLHLPEAKAEIRAAALACDAQLLLAPAYEGGHQDHDAASFLASTLASRWPVIEYAEYNARSPIFPRATGRETILTLTADESERKAALLRLYRSEAGNLRHIACRREALRPQARYDYQRPPHPGRLFYQRFAWVPFRHPRIDFTPPELVCAAFARFAADTRDRGGIHGSCSRP